MIWVLISFLDKDFKDGIKIWYLGIFYFLGSTLQVSDEELGIDLCLGPRFQERDSGLGFGY